MLIVTRVNFYLLCKKLDILYRFYMLILIYIYISIYNTARRIFSFV